MVLADILITYLKISIQKMIHHQTELAQYSRYLFGRNHVVSLGCAAVALQLAKLPNTPYTCTLCLVTHCSRKARQGKVAQGR